MAHKLLIEELKSAGNVEKAKFLQGFFKTGKGQYAENDVFLGITVPKIRSLVKAYKNLPLTEIEQLIYSEFHEVRFAGFILLVEQFKKSRDEAKRKEIYDFYLRHAKQANNWDLVDVSCKNIAGEYLSDKKDRQILYRLAESANLWEQRISIVSTLAFIKYGDFEDTLAISAKLLTHRHDLIHKAVGWMLREAGKKDKNQLVNFLDKYSSQMPRTALRYAIEHFSPEERAKQLSVNSKQLAVSNKQLTKSSSLITDNCSLIECVPNFSEGKDREKIRKITDSIEKVPKIKLLHVDSNADAGRTVVTFAGTPDAVCEAAFAAIKTASELIDMRLQHGKHPRLGSTDVCPLIPLKNIDMQTAVEYARKLAEHVGSELFIPVYCYENAAFVSERKNLAYCRKGEYESLEKKLTEQQPDFGPAIFSENVARTGATIIGARNLLIAVNFNLNTASKEIASQIAVEIRESGNGAKLKGIKAIGWYIDDFGIAQVSVNITDIEATPLHKVFEEVSKRAILHKVYVTGTEIVGLIPEKILLDAGKYFCSQIGISPTATKNLLLKTAKNTLGLDDLRPFVMDEKVLEYKI